MRVQTEFCRIAFQPPPLKQTDALWQVFFAENGQILWNGDFDFGNGDFENNCGQTRFLDGILMEIIVDNGEILCKFGSSVMVHIH